MPFPKVPNVAYLAAELYAARRVPMQPTKAAVDAAKLCSIGRRVKVLCEARACGLPEKEDTRACEKIAKLEKQASELLRAYHATYQRDSLVATVQTRAVLFPRQGKSTQETALL